MISAPVAKPDDAKADKTPDVDAPKAEQLPTLGYCFALYEYDAEASDELNLEEGQVKNYSYRSVSLLLNHAKLYRLG